MKKKKTNNAQVKPQQVIDEKTQVNEKNQKSNIVEFVKVNEHIINNENDKKHNDEFSRYDDEQAYKTLKKAKKEKNKLFEKKRLEREEKKLNKKIARRNYNKKYALFVIGSVILLLILFWMYSASQKALQRGTGKITEMASFEVDATGKYTYLPYRDGIIAATGESITYYNSMLEKQWSKDAIPGMPVADVNGAKALVCYNDTHNAYVVSGKNVTPLELTNNVIGGSINENGSCAVIANEEGYKAQVNVFDESGSEIYKWHSADNYVIDADISDDGDSMIVATLDFSKGTSSGGLMFFNFAQDKPYAGFVSDGNVIVDVKFLNKSRIAAVGEKKTVIYNVKGDVVQEISYNNMKLITYDIDENGNIIFCLSHDDSIMSDCDAVIYNANGKESGRQTFSSNIKAVSMTKGKALVVLERELIVLSDDGNEEFKSSINKDIKKAELLGDGKRAFIVSGTTAQIIKFD